MILYIDKSRQIIQVYTNRLEEKYEKISSLSYLKMEHIKLFFSKTEV